MINDENIMDLSDYADRDVKEEFAHIKDSIISLEKLIEAKEKSSDDSDALSKNLKATIRENIEEINLPIEQKCDALESKLNALSDSLNQFKAKQESNGRLLIANLICTGVATIILVSVFFSIFI